MSVTPRLFATLLAASLVHGGCKNADGDGAGGAGGASVGSSSGGGGASDGEGGHPTAGCFEPTPASGEEGFVATDGANTKTYEITLPDDPEGGLVTVTITGRQIFSGVRVQGAEGGTFLSINGEGADGPASLVQSFVGAPGVTYEVEIEEAWVSNTESSSQVDFAWKLETARDCFEPNDTPVEARDVEVGEDVVAYAFAGYTTNDWPSYEDHDDYYAIDVTAAGTLRVAVQPGPDPIALEILAIDAPDQILADGFTSDEQPFSVELAVAAGRHLLRVQPFVSPVYNSFDGEVTQWDHPYTLTATIE